MDSRFYAALGVAGLVTAAAFATQPLAAGQSYTVTLKYDIVDDGMPENMTGIPGDAENGRKVAIHRQMGNCLACHEMPVPEQPFHGRIAPTLDGVGSRYTEAQLRLRIVNPKFANPDTIMPGFYRTEGLTMVAGKFQGATILTDQQVEDVVAYLMTLKEGGPAAQQSGPKSVQPRREGADD